MVEINYKEGDCFIAFKNKEDRERRKAAQHVSKVAGSEGVGQSCTKEKKNNVVANQDKENTKILGPSTTRP